MKDPKKIVSLSEREKSMAQDQTQKQLRDMVGGGTNPAPKVREERREGEERRLRVTREAGGGALID